MDKEYEKSLLKRSRFSNGQQYTRKCSSLIIKEIQVIITMRDHLPSVGTAIIKKTKDKSWQGRGEKGIQWQCKLVQSVWKRVGRFLKKLKIQLPYDPAITLLGISIKDMKAAC